MIRRILLGLLAIVTLLALYVAGGWFGFYGRHEDAGTPTAATIPAAVVSERAAVQRPAATALSVAAPDKQILFGDLHVHTTFSLDAFMSSAADRCGGEGAHPLADACDFARYCSALDFWSINDHAEAHHAAALAARRSDAIRAVQRGRGRRGEPRPRRVPRLGVDARSAPRPTTHYGHKNVILRDTRRRRDPDAPDRRAARARDDALRPRSARAAAARPVRADFATRRRYCDFDRASCARSARVPRCARRRARARAAGRLPRVRPTTPADLFAKLDEWGYDAIVIPHGTTWGFYTPPGSAWDKQLVGEQHDPERQKLIEVFSGHGNSEEFRAWREVEFDADGKRDAARRRAATTCRRCWRAGEIIRARCRAAGERRGRVRRRAPPTRAQHYARRGRRRRIAPCPARRPRTGSTPASVATASCPPSTTGRAAPRSTSLALGELRRPRAAAALPLRLHRLERQPLRAARHRLQGVRAQRHDGVARPPSTPTGDAARCSLELRRAPTARVARASTSSRRGAGFRRLRGGAPGLVLHDRRARRGARGRPRSRDAIWDALAAQARSTAPAAQRILLWFDLLNPPGSRGAAACRWAAHARWTTRRVFHVRAVGSFEQKPGCPDVTRRRRSTPSASNGSAAASATTRRDARRLITRIEVVRIRPQRSAGEPIEDADRGSVARASPASRIPAGCTVSLRRPRVRERRARRALLRARDRGAERRP